MLIQVDAPFACKITAPSVKRHQQEDGETI
jgi:hypothetical protein